MSPWSSSRANISSGVGDGRRWPAIVVLCWSYAIYESVVFRRNFRETVLVRDRGVGGSNPLAPTKISNEFGPLLTVMVGRGPFLLAMLATVYENR